MPLIKNIIEGEGANPDAFANDPVPVQEVVSEKPWHRIAIMLAAQGCSVTEIARRVDRQVPWVSILLRQPWARERLAKEITEQGRDEIETLLKGASSESLRRVIELGQTADSDAVKLAANREILDRFLGKPVQKVESKAQVTLDMDAINAELRALEAQEKVLLGASRDVVPQADSEQSHSA